MPLHGYTDLYGNPCTRVVLPAGRPRFRYQAAATVPDATEDADERRRRCRPTGCPTRC